MSKKLILFLMVLLFGSTSFLRADEVTIGDPTVTETSSYLPGYSLYNYALSQQIYTADEIGMGGTISDVTLWLKNSSSYARNYNIYMKEVSETTFADDNSWVAMTAADLVATGVLADGISSPVATTFTLSTPFNYTGMGNLVICFQDVTGSWSSGAASVIMVTTGNQAIYAYRDSGTYDPSAPGASGTTIAKKSVVRLTIEGVVPPTAGVSIIPDEFILGDKALNSNVWKEPFAAKIYNGGEPTVISASLSNTSGENAFIMSEEILDMPLATGEATDFTLTIQNGVPSGEYVEEFTLFYTENRSIMTVPVVANIYNASYPDVVEYARTMSWTSGAYTDTPDADNMHADYNLWGMDEKLPDVVYQFTLPKDSHFHAEAGNDFIAIYKKVSDLHLTAEVEPLILGENGVIEDEIMFAGTYYLVAASDAITTVSANFTELPAPEEIAFVNPTPADGATSINAPVTIKWAPTDITATEYQVVFGTSPIVNADPEAWIPMDDNFGTYVVTELLPTTQYFYKVFARNSNGVVSTERRGFTSTLIAPHAVTASETEIFVDQTTLIKWKLAGQGGFTGEVTVADGTATSSYVPVYGLWVDDFTRSEMIYPAEMLEEMEGGEITSLTFYLSTPATTAWAPAQFNVYMREVTGTTLSSYFGSADATIVYSGTLDGTGTTMTINLDTPYTYDGGNLLIGIEEPVEGTYKSAYFYGVAASGASASGYSSSALSAVSFNQRDFLPKVTFTCGGRGNRDLIGYNVYYGQKNTENEYVYTKANNSMLTEREYLLGNLPYDVTTDGLDINVTAVYDQGESVHSTPIVKVWVSGYGKLTGTVTELISGAPVAGVNVKFMGKDEFNNNVTFEGTTNSLGKYTINNVKAGQYIGQTILEGMEPSYSDQVTLAYNGTETVNFVIHEEYKQVLSVYAEEVDPTMSRVKWSLTENIGPGPQPGGPTTFTEGFEGSLNGWNVLTLLADGGSWIHSSQNLGGYDYSTVAHSGTGFAMCYSFVDNVGACSTDSYMYTPQKYSIVNGSTLRFFADNANDTYPENFSVCVSTADNPSSSADFTQVWSGGAKGTGSNGAMVRHADNRYENWREHVIDLSSFAGQNVWIAFHDVNTDCYEIWIDDVELGVANKGDRAPLSYKVFLEGKFVGETIYPFFQVPVEGLVEGDVYTVGVAPLYATGMGDMMNATFTYSACSNYEGVTNYAAAVDNNDVTLTWTLPSGTGPTPPPTPGTTWTDDFEDGNLSNWTTIDADGDGDTWQNATPAAYGIGNAHSGTNCASSWSWNNVSLDPDNYMISPLSENATSIKYYVATNVAYPDHYAIIASSTGTNVGDFTIVFEENVGSKGGNGVKASMNSGNSSREMSDWFEKNITLPAGTKYVGFRHFNSYDMNYLFIDDVTITMGGSKGGRAVVYEPHFVTDPGAMANGADASWIKDTQATWGPNCNNASGYKIADDFTLTSATTISEIEVYGYQTGSTTTSTFTGLYAQIYNGAPNAGGTAVWGDGTTNLMTATSFTNCYRGSDGTTTATTRPVMAITASGLNIQLEAGTYYLVWSLAGSASSGPWAQPEALPGVGNTGNGLQYGSSGWAALTDSGSGTPYGAAFKLVGEGSGPGPGPQPGNILGVMIWRDAEPLTFAPLNATTFTDAAVEEGEYDYTIRVVYDDYSMSCEQTIEVTVGGGTVCDPVTNLTAEHYNYQGNNGALVQFTEPAGATSYKVYVEGQLLGSLTAQPIFINFEGSPDGDYEIGIVAVYASCESDMATTTFTWDAIAENDVVNAIYPNPTSNNLHINATAMTHVSVYNAMGQMVYDQEVSGDELILNMGQYEAGVYMVKVTTETGSSVKRINVVK